MARGAALTLPWLAVLAISASVAYGATMALTGGGLVEPHQVVTTVIDAPASSEGCDNMKRGWMVYVGLNTWIPVSNRGGPCAQGTITSE
jgi:ABC-type sugar transport system substrate-binding protein